MHYRCTLAVTVVVNEQVVYRLTEVVERVLYDVVIVDSAVTEISIGGTSHHMLSLFSHRTCE